MPYFIDERNGQFCVIQGTKEDPGDVEKCHETREAATAHMRALYANVEDASKSVADVLKGLAQPNVSGLLESRIHASFTAVADRLLAMGYLNKEERIALSHAIGVGLDAYSATIAELGLQNRAIEDYEVRDILEAANKATTAPNSTANLPHGTGGLFALGQALGEENGEKAVECVCPECGARVPKKLRVPCNEIKCPECGAMMRLDTGSAEKAEWTAAYVNDLPDSSFLYIESGGEKDEEGKTKPRSLRHFPYKDAAGKVDLPHLRNAIARIPQSNASGLTPEKKEQLQERARRMLEEAQEGKSKFVTYKTAAGAWRWLSVSNVAVQDREGEIVSEKAYDDAIGYARKSGVFGELDLVHVPGTDVGDADFMARLGSQLVEGGSWRDDPSAVKAREVVQARPDDWGVSIMFRYDPSQFDGITYKGGIRILKRSILPRDMAASHGTAIAVVGGDAVKMQEMTEEVKDALARLGRTPEEIAELAEKAKAAPADAYVVAKEKEGLWRKLGQLLGVAKADPDVTAPPAAVESQEVKEPEASPQPAEEKGRPEAAATPPAFAMGVDVAKLIGEQVAQMVAGTVESAVSPLRNELAPLRDELAAVKQKLADAEKRLAETEKSVEAKVNERLASLPPVVTVRTTEVAATEAPAQAVKEKNPTADFVKSVQDLVNRGLKSGDLKIEI